MLSEEEKYRYARHLSLEHVGEEGQGRLKDASVLVIGAGGLGSPVLQYLAAAGVGRIGVVDGDQVEESNLQRQVLFTVGDVGKNKAQQAKLHLEQLNPLITIESHNEFVTVDNALNLCKGYDFVIDGTDNFATRYLIGDASLITGKPLVYGSIFKFQGQVAVFNVNNGPTYRCLFPNPPDYGEVPSCSEVGVLGVLPGMIGTYMANECLKLILGVGSRLEGKLMMIDALDLSHHSVELTVNLQNHKRTHLEDSYDSICASPVNPIEISLEQFEQLTSDEEIQIVDVREPFEYSNHHIPGSINIPLGTLKSRLAEVNKNVTTICICQRGQRSLEGARILKEKGVDEVWSLSGGMNGVK